MQAYNNDVEHLDDYAEVIMTTRRTSAGTPVWTISSTVFSKDSKFNLLVDYRRTFFEKDRAEEALSRLAQHFGLSKDDGLVRRNRLFGVKV